MFISSRTTEADEDDPIELELVVAVLPSCSCSSFLRAGNRPGLASRSAFSISRSTLSMVELTAAIRSAKTLNGFRDRMSTFWGFA